MCDSFYWPKNDTLIQVPLFENLKPRSFRSNIPALLLAMPVGTHEYRIVCHYACTTELNISLCTIL